MIFTKEHAPLVLAGRKNQTRRIWTPNMVPVAWTEGRITRIDRLVGTNKDRRQRLWEVGRWYAIQDGRGRPELGRFELVGLRQELLQDISPDDVVAEGVEELSPEERTLMTASFMTTSQGRAVLLHLRFAAIWDAIYPAPHRWIDNPTVAVLEIGAIRGWR